MRCCCVSRSPHGATRLRSLRELRRGLSPPERGARRRKRNAGQVSRISLRSIRAAIAALTLISAAVAQEKPDETPATAEEQAAAPAQEKPAPAPAGEATESICLLIESAAAANGLPVEFFARVIWRESHYNPNAVGPPTRSGERAQGIGQFMPGTAAERRLLDPLDPVEALPKSAEFLRDLRGQFGNLGLAAAAYNAGPQRVRDWLAGRRTLPRETRNYVKTVRTFLKQAKHTD